MQELSYQDQHNERCEFLVGVIYNGERLTAIYTDKGLRYNGEILDAAGISDWWVKTEVKLTDVTPDKRKSRIKELLDKLGGGE